MSAEFENKVLSAFEKMDQRFEQIDQRFEQIDQRFEQIDQRFEQIDQKLERRTDLIMEYIYDLSKITRETNKKVDSMDKRLQTVESIVKQRWDIPKLADKVDALAYEVAKHTERLDEHDRKLAAITN